MSAATGFNFNTERRAKILQVWDGYQPMHDVLQQLCHLEISMPIHLLDPAYSWLIKNKVVGKNFVTFYMDECSSSPLELIRVLTAKVRKEAPRALYIDKDVRR